jgi:hypothetical protein
MEIETTVTLNREEVEAALDAYLQEKHGLLALKFSFQFNPEFGRFSCVKIVVKEK